jgi:hypothetical protein
MCSWEFGDYQRSILHLYGTSISKPISNIRPLHLSQSLYVYEHLSRIFNTRLLRKAVRICTKRLPSSSTLPQKKLDIHISIYFYANTAPPRQRKRVGRRSKRPKTTIEHRARPAQNIYHLLGPKVWPEGTLAWMAVCIWSMVVGTTLLPLQKHKLAHALPSTGSAWEAEQKQKGGEGLRTTTWARRSGSW